MKKVISKSKRNNQKRNKLVKSGVIKSKKKINKSPKVPLPATLSQSQPIRGSDDEQSDNGEEMLAMMDPDDIQFIKEAIGTKTYSILNKIRHSDSKGRKRKQAIQNDDLENNYESEKLVQVPVKSLLPIKTKDGLIKRSMEQMEEDEEQTNNHSECSGNESEASGDEQLVFDDVDVDTSGPISMAQLIASREETLTQKKIHIGTLSAGLLEFPEEKVTNLRTLLQILDLHNAEMFLSIRKLCLISLLEVFKDLLPSYQLTTRDGTTKLKKETLKLNKFETSLLLYYKKYLQHLEKIVSVLIKRRGDNRVRSEADIHLAEIAIHALCELLITHPYFNYAQNIAQVLIPFLNNRNEKVRRTICDSCKLVFKEDKKEEITLQIIRILNQFIKNRAHNVHTEMLEILLYLRIKDVNLDREKEEDIKQKKYMARKERILQLSKKEKKRMKRLDNLKKEMLETKAEESVKDKQKNLTEITKILFGIYFRVLKSSNNTKVLGVCLEGLAKFAHCINLEYYVDVVNLLDKLLKEDFLGYKEQLHCIQTVFVILSGYGETLNLDPTRFYVALYSSLLKMDAAFTHVQFPILLDTLNVALIKRQKKLSTNRSVGFIKRLVTTSLQVMHDNSLSMLCVVKGLLQLCESADIILDLESTSGGQYKSDIDDPEFCNAMGTALFETVLLSKHYHPVVQTFAKHIARGVPASGQGSLPIQYGKCSPVQLFEDYKTAEMCFNPAIPVPKRCASKSRTGRVEFSDSDYRMQCMETLKNRPVNIYMDCS